MRHNSRRKFRDICYPIERFSNKSFRDSVFGYRVVRIRRKTRDIGIQYLRSECITRINERYSAVVTTDRVEWRGKFASGERLANLLVFSVTNRGTLFTPGLLNLFTFRLKAQAIRNRRARFALRPIPASLRDIGFTGEYLYINNDPFDTGTDIGRGISDLLNLFTKNGTEQFFLRSILALTFRCNLSDEYTSRADDTTDANDPFFIELREPCFANVRNVACNFFGTDFRLTCLDLELFNVDRGEGVPFNKTLADEDRIFVVVATPRHISTQHVPSEGEFPVLRRSAVCNDLFGFHCITDCNDRMLMDTGTAVTPLESLKFVNIVPHLTEGILAFIVVEGFTGVYENFISRDACNGASACRGDECAGKSRSGLLHPCSNQRCFWADEWNGLALMVRAHQCPVGVFVFQKWNERSGDTHNLLRGDPDIVDSLHRKRLHIFSTTNR